MAAQSLVINGIENPTLTFDVNIMGTVNITEIARLNPSVKSILIVTSDKVYEKIMKKTRNLGKVID